MEICFMEDQVKKLSGLIEEVQADLIKSEDKLLCATAETNRLREELKDLRSVKQYFENELATDADLLF
jgi:hypothetical protein